MSEEEEKAGRQKEVGGVSSREPVGRELARIPTLSSEITLIYVLIARQQTTPTCRLNARTKTVSKSALKPRQSPHTATLLSSLI